MAFQKTANAVVADIITLNSWEKMQGKKAFGQKTAAAPKISADQSRYLLSHCTIMASVMTEDEPHDYLVKAECSHLINSNHDGWENGVLRLAYPSFVGAFNFYEHVQKTKESKGHILDAVLRKVVVAPGVFVYYVDLLVATDRSHEDLVADILTGKTKYMSMGCVTELVICSYCGARCTEYHTYCQHLLANKGDFLMDDDGIPRRVGELCGHKSLPNGGVKFVEASWVGTPAFAGAAQRGIITEEWVGPKTPFTRALVATGNKKVAAVSKEEFESMERRSMNAKLRGLL
jgi:hypothetical protein